MPLAPDTDSLPAEPDPTPPRPARIRAFRLDGERFERVFDVALFTLLIAAAAMIATALPADAQPANEPAPSAREQPLFTPDDALAGAGSGGAGQIAAMARGLVDGHRWIAVEFSGETLRLLGSPAMVEPVVSLSGGEVLAARIESLAAPGRWRLMIEFDPQEAQAIDMRASLHLHSQAVTETWTYSWNR